LVRDYEFHLLTLKKVEKKIAAKPIPVEKKEQVKETPAPEPEPELEKKKNHKRSRDETKESVKGPEAVEKKKSSKSKKTQSDDSVLLEFADNEIRGTCSDFFVVSYRISKRTGYRQKNRSD
jgi:hypothetical protein